MLKLLSRRAGSLSQFRLGYFVGLFDTRVAGNDRFGTHRVFCSIHAANFLKHGYEPILLDLAEIRSWGKDFYELLSGKLPVIVHCEQAAGMELTINSKDKTKPLASGLNTPFVTQLRDYPFYPWIRRRLSQLSDCHYIFHTIPSGLSYSQDAFPSKGNHIEGSNFYMDYSMNSEAASLPPSSRQIHCLYVGSYLKPILDREKYLSKYPKRENLFDDAVERLIYETELSPIEVIGELKSANLGEPLELAEASDLDLLHHVSRFVHHHRREALLRKTSKLPMHLIWSGEMPDKISLHPSTKVEKNVPLNATHRLMENSRSVLMSLLFNDSLSERMLTAMHRGAAVLSNESRVIENTFESGSELLLYKNNLNGIEESLDLLNDDLSLDEMAERARARVENDFSPENYVRDILKELKLPPFEA